MITLLEVEMLFIWCRGKHSVPKCASEFRDFRGDGIIDSFKGDNWKLELAASKYNTHEVFRHRLHKNLCIRLGVFNSFRDYSFKALLFKLGCPFTKPLTTMGRTDFDRLLDRYIKGEVTEAERKKMDAWLDVVKTKDQLDFEFTKEDEAKLFTKITSNLHNVEEIKDLADEVEKRSKPFFSSWAMMASVTFAVVAFTYIGFLVKAKFDAVDEIMLATTDQMILQDGTIVWLTKGSTLSYFQKDGIRHASLDGEGLFEVAKDAAHPFIVNHGDINLRVVGTSFNLRTDDRQITLQVLTGKVNLTSAQDSIGVDIVPDEKIIYSESGTKERVPLSRKERSELVDNTEYNMNFQDTPLELVFARIEKKFKMKVDLKTPVLNKCRINADFTDVSLERTFALLTDMLHLEYVIKEGTVTVSGQECK